MNGPLTDARDFSENSIESKCVEPPPRIVTTSIDLLLSKSNLFTLNLKACLV